MSIKQEKEIKINDNLSFNNELYRQTGLNLIHQNMTKEEFIAQAYGHHKATSENKSIWLFISICFNIMFIFLFLAAISTAFKILN